MQRHSSCLLFVVAVVLASAGSAARSAATLGDASAVHDWPAVMALGEGAALRPALSAGASTNGWLVSAEAAQITISTGSAKRTLLVPDIRRIAVVERRTKQKAKWGFMIGAVGGGLLGGLGTQSNQGAWAAMLAAGWGRLVR
jgi:hypothetical protein